MKHDVHPVQPGQRRQSSEIGVQASHGVYDCGNAEAELR